MLETVGDAGAKMLGYPPLHVARNILANDIAAEWKWKAGLVAPQLSRVSDEMQALVFVGELALVDEQAGVHISAHYGVLDLIEGYDDRLEFGEIQAKREI